MRAESIRGGNSGEVFKPKVAAKNICQSLGQFGKKF
jgi:hypothetical protein